MLLNWKTRQTTKKFLQTSRGATAQTLTTSGDIGTASNWSGATLPTNSASPGTIAIDGTVDGSVTYSGLYIEQSDGDITQNSQGGGGYTFENGSYLMTGGTWATRRGLVVGTSQTFTIDGGTFGVAVPGGGGDSLLSINSGGNLNLLSGSVTVSTDNVFNTGGTLTISGGAFTSLGNFGNAGFNGSGGITNFNGGSISLNTVSFAGGTGILNFDGTSSGSVSAASLAGNFSLDWFSGSLMSLTVTGANQAYYEGLYSGGDLNFEGSNANPFATNFSVSGETLSLVPEPSSFALLSGLLALGLVARRRRA